MSKMFMTAIYSENILYCLHSYNDVISKTKMTENTKELSFFPSKLKDWILEPLMMYTLVHKSLKLTNRKLRNHVNISISWKLDEAT